MTAAPLSGPGLGLPIPQNLYPSELSNTPYDTPTNSLALAPGEAITLPRGNFIIDPGFYALVQYLDPVNGVWSRGRGGGYQRGQMFVQSDGFNVRVANLTGCPVGAVITAAGSGYVQGTTTVVPTPGNSTWQPIIGGQLANVNSPTLATAGAGYGIAPLVFIPSPPPPTNNPNGAGGAPASGYCVIASGTVSAFSFTSLGSGYPSPPTPVVLPSPFDPNINLGITQATLSFSLTGSGSLTGLLCTNNGAPLTPAAGGLGFTLTVAGAGTGATVSAIILQTITKASVTGSGAGYGATGLALLTTGGVPPQGSIVNADSLFLSWIPRQPNISLPSVTAGGTGTIYDGGLFTALPTAFVVGGLGGGTGTLPTIALTMGGTADIISIQGGI